MLERAQLAAETCTSFDGLCATLDEGCGALLVSDEALTNGRVEHLSALLKEQPAWSDLPVLIMTSGGEATAASQRRLETLAPLNGPMTLLERPLRIATLLSAVRAALRGRRRQYEIRDLLITQQQNAGALAAANQALQRSNQDLAHFAYSASHDLKEPLRNVAVYTQMLSRKYSGRLDTEADEFINFAVDGVKRMQQLIEDLLSYAQVTNNTTNGHVCADSAVTLGNAVDHLSLLMKETGGEIQYGVLPVVAVEPTQLTQLFQNLLSNALKYRKPDEPPRIQITAVPHRKLWEFCVSDNGVGFAQSDSELIFGIFKRLHGREVAGTGIGLAMCKRIVEHYGGEIRATSEPGQGATFLFTLPAAPEA